MIDKTTKIILALIAGGLWANAIGINVNMNKAYARYCGYDDDQCKANAALIEIQDDIHKIANGMCLNGKLC